MNKGKSNVFWNYSKQTTISLYCDFYQGNCISVLIRNPLTANAVAALSVSERYGSNQLLDARVVLISQEKCKAPHVYGDSLDDSMFCAGNMNGGVDSCQV